MQAGGAYGVPSGYQVPQPAPHPAYGGIAPTNGQQQPVMGQPLAYNTHMAPPPPHQQFHVQPLGYQTAPPPPGGSYQPAPSAYPTMPSGVTSPVVDNSGNITNNWEALVLQVPTAPNGSPIGFPPNPLQAGDTRWQMQNGNATDEILENRICQGIKLKDCELRNCYVVECVVKDSLCKGGYYTSSKLKECEFQNTKCIISCVMDESIAKWSDITNTQIREGDLQKCNSLDCKVVDSNVFGGTAIRCNLSKCGIERTRQEGCVITESGTSARQSVP